MNKYTKNCAIKNGFLLCLPTEKIFRALQKDTTFTNQLDNSCSSILQQ